MSKKRIQCVATYFLDHAPTEILSFDDGIPQLKVESALGPNGLDNVAKDLIDIGVLVFLIERYAPGKQRMNRLLKIDVKIGLREPSVWTANAVQALEEVLYFMGGTHWNFEFSLDNTLSETICFAKEEAFVKRVILFSGGLDSLCGAATLCNEDNVRLVSFYTRQKSLQRRLAQELGMVPPIQWGWKSSPPSGRGKNFRYRSLLFLCLAAVTGRSYSHDSSHIIQFENGILASSVAPSPALQTTKHAHYRVHRLCELIFSEIFKAPFLIENPFALSTKREVYFTMVSIVGENKARKLADQTETCWNLYAGFKIGQEGHEIRKENGVPCGFCVPCILRQTALPQKTWLDLQHDEARNHPEYGRLFREYYGMLRRIQEVRMGSLGEFYTAMDTFLQDIIQPEGSYQLNELRVLFLRFADEFMDTYKLG